MSLNDHKNLITTDSDELNQPQDSDDSSGLLDAANNGPRPLNLRPSIISEGFSFTGEIKAPGGFLTIDGQFQGSADTQELIVGSSGVVNGALIANNVTIKGELKGQLTTKDLTIGSQALVDGQVAYDFITIHRGGTVKGDLKRTK